MNIEMKRANEIMQMGIPIKVKRLNIYKDNCQICNSKSFTEEELTNAVEVFRLDITAENVTFDNVISVKTFYIEGDNCTIEDAVDILDLDDCENYGENNHTPLPTENKVKGFGTTQTNINIGTGGIIINGSTVVKDGTIDINGKIYRGNTLTNKAGEMLIDGIPLSQCTPIN